MGRVGLSRPPGFDHEAILGVLIKAMMDDFNELRSALIFRCGCLSGLMSKAYLFTGARHDSFVTN